MNQASLRSFFDNFAECLNVRSAVMRHQLLTSHLIDKPAQKLKIPGSLLTAQKLDDIGVADERHQCLASGNHFESRSRVPSRSLRKQINNAFLQFSQVETGSYAG